MQKLEILLLGPLEFKYEGNQLHIRRRLVRTLLAYLGYLQTMISRAELILLLWPDESDAVGRKRLREILSKLRQELPDADILLTVDDQVGLDQKRIYIDALEFELLNEQIIRSVQQVPENMALPDKTYQRILQAINLWRSPLFMAGFNPPDTSELDHWFSETRNVLENSRLSLLEHLADHEAAIGDLENAVQNIRKVIELDRLNEVHHIRLIKWLMALGRRNEAITHRNYLEKLFLQEGYLEIPKGIDEICDSVVHPSKLSEVDEKVFWPAPSFIRVAFVNRQEELKKLKTAYQQGGIVSLRGESGVGKTRLVYELFQNLTPSPRLLFAPSRIRENNFSFQPLIELLRYSILQEEWQNLDKVWIKHLLNLLPELNISFPDLSPPGEILATDVKTLIYEAVHQLFLLSAKKDRILLFFDDAQWIDQDTLGLLSYLIERNFFPQKGLLVFTSEINDQNHQFEEFLEYQTVVQPYFTSIELGDLGEQEVAMLVQHVLGRRWKKNQLENLIQKTGGNPLFLIETLRAVLEFSPDSVYSENIDYLPVPGSIQTLIRDRLKKLSLKTHQMLYAAALVGMEFTPDILEAVSGQEMIDIVQQLEEAEHLNIIRPSIKADTLGEYTFVYEKIREVLQLELSQARKRVLHHQIANGLVSLGMDDGKNAVQVARHYQLSGKLKKSFDYWVKAANYFRRFYSTSDVQLSFNKAEKLFEKLDKQISDEEVLIFYRSWGDFADDIDDNQGSYRAFTNLERIGKQRKSVLLVGAGLSGKGRALRRQGRYQESLECNRSAIEYLEKAEDVQEMVRGYNRLAIVLTQMGYYDDANATYERSIKLAADSGESDLQDPLANTLLQMARIYNFRGRPDKAIELAERSSQRYKNLFDVLYTSINEGTHSQAYYLKGEYRRASEMNSNLLRIAQEMKIWRLEVVTLVQQSQTSLFLGELDNSWTYIQRAEELIQRSGEYLFNGRMYCVKGNILRMLQNYKSAIEIHKIGVRNSREPYFLLDNEIRLSLSQLRLGDVKNAKKQILHAIKEAYKQDYGYIYLPGELVLASILSNEGAYEEAQNKIEQVMQEAENYGLMPVVYNGYLFLADNYIKKGDLVSAEENALKLIENADRIGYIWLEIFGYRRLNKIKKLRSESNAEIKEKLGEKMEYLRERTTIQEIRLDLEKFFDKIIDELTCEK